MAHDVEPPELARLLDVAERPRVGDWSLRSALVRYAQPEPRRVGGLLEVQRRIDGALHGEAKRFDTDGPALWAALQDHPADDGATDPVVALLRAAAVMDDLGDRLATWADDPSGPRPDAAVDEVTRALGAALDLIGVPRESAEDRPRPPRGARSRG